MGSTKTGTMSLLHSPRNAALLLPSVLLAVTGHATDYQWNGTTGDWQTASNWSSTTTPPYDNLGVVPPFNTSGPDRLNVNGATPLIYSAAEGTTTFANAAGRGLVVGSPSTAGAMTLTGGTFSTLGSTSPDVIANAGSTTSTVTLAGGTLIGNANGLILGLAGTGVVNLDSGTLSMFSLSKGAGTANFNFNGGTLQALQTTSAFMTGLSAATVHSGGAIVDSNGFDITIEQVLLAGSPSGGLTKNGVGALTLSGVNSTYTGATTVNGGTLVLGSGTATFTYNGGNLAINGASTLRIAGGRYRFGGKTFTFDSAGGGTLDAIATGAGGFSFDANNTFATSGGAQNLITGTKTGSGNQGFNLDGDTAIFNVAPGSDPVSDLKMTGTIWNTGSITKTGPGRLELTGANTYTGATTVSEGTLICQNSYASPSHSIASGATLEFNVASGTADRASTTFSGAGTLQKTGTGILLWGSAATTFSLGSGALIDVQGGTFTAGSNNNEIWTTNKADLNVAPGATFDGVEGAIFVDALSGSGTIKSGYTGYSSTITFGVDGGSGTFTGVLANSQAAGNYTKAGAGTQTLGNSNTYTGATTVNGGVLNLAANQTIKTGNTLTVHAGATVNLASATGDAVRDLSTITLNGGTLADTSATANHNHAILLSAGRTLNMQNGASLIGTGAAAGHSTYGQIFLGYGNVTVNVSGTPASLWDADIRWGNVGGAATTVNVATGSTLLVAGHLGHFEGSQWAFLNLTGGGTLIMTDGTGNQNTTTIGAGATMQIGDGGTTGDLPNGAVSGAGGVINNGTLVFNRGNAYAPIRAISGTGRVVQNGGGTVTLSQNNSYSGETEVNAGTLLINGTHTGGGMITVSSAATLGGTGTMVDVTVKDGGLLSPGSSAGTISIAALTLESGAILNLELGAPEASDKILVTDFFGDGAAELNVSLLVPGTNYPVDTRWLVVDYTGATLGSANQGALLTLGTNTTGLNLAIDATREAGKVFLAVVPEPSAAALFALALLVLRRRFKR